jgi:excisionase family DNA binding protein
MTTTTDRPTVPDDLMTVAELSAARRPATRNVIYELRKSGRLPYWRMGRTVYVSLADFDALFERYQETG